MFLVGEWWELRIAHFIHRHRLSLVSFGVGLACIDPTLLEQPCGAHGAEEEDGWGDETCDTYEYASAELDDSVESGSS